MTKNNYCITGLAGAGKDTVGAYLAAQMGRDTYALAYPIKRLVSALLGTSIEDLEDRNKKEKAAFYVVTIQSLQEVAEVYHELGLDAYQDFPDAWGEWESLFRFKLTPWGTYETWLAPRHFFQLLGTEWGRALHEDVWVRMAPEDAIITDVRMPNEARYFIDKRYTLLDIVRPNQEEIESSSHVSESGVGYLVPKLTIRNNGNIPQLYEVLDCLLP